MSTPPETRYKVFYSWQSELPDMVNLKLIRNALNQAANSITAEHDLNLHVVIDEATREVPGSPNIAGSIFTKIKDADVFVCDLTKVAEMNNHMGETRKFCNPNVAIELGYAVRVLGWNRIIIVFNEGCGTVPDDLPFDARGHRTATYLCKAEFDEQSKPGAACKSQISNSTGALRTTFIDALKLIAKENPKRPQETEGKSLEEIRRERDVEQLSKVFYWIHLGVMDCFIDRLVNHCRLTNVGSDFCDALTNVVNSSSFHFKDLELRHQVVGFCEAWNRCLTYAWDMDASNNQQEAYFRLPGDMFVSKEQEDHYQFTQTQAQPLRVALDSLLGYVREHYIEIDPTICGREAVREYEEYEAKVKAMFCE